MWEHLNYKIVYLIFLGIVVALEHRWFSKAWQRYERARWVMGVLTVFVLALPLAIEGTFHMDTLAWLLVAFGVSGLVTIGLYVNEAAKVNRNAREIAQTLEQGTGIPGESDGAGDSD